MSSKNFMAYDDAVSVLTEYASDIKGKTDKVASATADDFATLDSNGNLTDSGISKAVVPSGATSSNKLVTANDISTLPNKADKVSGATNGHLAGLDANGDLTDSGVVANNVIEKVSTATGLLRDDGTVDTSTYATTAQLESKADKVINASNGHLAGLDSNGNLTDSGVLATSISGKADKVVSATDGDLAKLNSYGNLIDSGISASDVVTKSSTTGLIKNDGTIDTNSYATNSTAYLTSDTTETTSNVNSTAKNVSSETPQTEINTPAEDINNISHADNVSWNKATSNDNATSSGSSNTDAESTGETSGSVEHTFTKKGNQGVNTYAHDMIEFRTSIIDVTMQILEDSKIKELFMQVF